MRDYKLSTEKRTELEASHCSLRDKRQAARVKAVIALSIKSTEYATRSVALRIFCIALGFPAKNRRMFPANKTLQKNRHFSKNMSRSKQARVKMTWSISPMSEFFPKTKEISAGIASITDRKLSHQRRLKSGRLNREQYRTRF